MNRVTKIIHVMFVALCMLLNMGSNCYAQTKTEKIDQLLRTYSEYGKFNGSILVAEKGKIIYKKGFGMANREWNISNQPDTKFRLASVSKQFTSMVILQLVQQGKLKLDVPISTYLPDYPKSSGDIVTLHHLLSHTSGIPNYTSFRGFRKNEERKPYTPTEFVKYFADSALQFKPGERFSYSNSGYFLLGVIIEKVTGKSYEKVVQENIFTPLNMNNSGYDHYSTVIKNRASGYTRNGLDYVNAPYLDMSLPFSAGSLYSTVEDLYLWDQALYTEQLLQKNYRDLLYTKHVASGSNYYGYGWVIGELPVGSSKEQVQMICHSGGINGFNTLITRIPSDKSSIILLNNMDTPTLKEITVAINGILHDQPYDLPKKSIANFLAEQLDKNGIENAAVFYKEVKDSKEYYLDEAEVNLQGYEFLKKSKPKEAAYLFKLNTEAYPKSSNTYDSYGEALLALGDKTLAIENYKKSVTLNPGNEGGKKVLKDNGVNTDELIKKIPLEDLKLLEGTYLVTNPPSSEEKDWKIKFQLEKGTLYGFDRGYRYPVLPVTDDEFVNPDDGASLVFDTKDKNAITLTLFGRFKFKKV